MDLLSVIILGIVEGVTEFLPVSSTGHLILTAKFLNLAQTDFVKSFEIAIQLGAILAVVVLYWRSLLVDHKTLCRVFAAFVPTALLGFIFYKLVKRYLLSSELIVLAALFVGGVVLIIFELAHHDKNSNNGKICDISYKQALIIGACQALAIIPGVSRSLATILGGLALGISRKVIVQFSFLLAVPTMLAATAYDLAKSSGHFSAGQFHSLAVGFVVSFIVALVSIRFLVAYIEKHNFIIFGVYRIIAALLLLIIFS